jgi:RNA polymerase sigma factor (sigma-70 family)
VSAHTPQARQRSVRSGPGVGLYHSPVTGTPPGALVRAAAAGDQAAWDALVERFAPLLWSIARGHGLGSADAADVSQTTWLRLVEHLDRIREPDRLAGWLAVTARNECLRILRRSGRDVPSLEETIDLSDPRLPPVEAGVLVEERDQLLWRAFEGLSPRCQLLLRLVMADPPLSYQEVGELLGIPIGSIGPTRGRCLAQLRDEVGPTGITSDPAGSVG